MSNTKHLVDFEAEIAADRRGGVETIGNLCLVLLTKTKPTSVPSARLPPSFSAAAAARERSRVEMLPQSLRAYHLPLHMLVEFHSVRRGASEEGALVGVVGGMIGEIRSGGAIRSVWRYSCRLHRRWLSTSACSWLTAVCRI